MLRFSFIGNACGIFIGKNGTRVLCDPWLVDGVFEGSWCHYPPLKTKVEDVLGVDAVYVSHLHPDHFDDRHFNFAKDKPLIVLDHGRNFLPKKLQAMGYTNLIAIKECETVKFNELEITLFAPFVKHAYEDAELGNLIDSAMLISCDGVSAFDANDNNPGRFGDVSAAEMIGREYGPIGLAMLPYNGASGFPSCFDHFTDAEKVEKSRWVLGRNFELMREEILAMKPRFVLPFAGAYVLGGDLRHKNAYLGTTTWDECADWLRERGITNVRCLREGDVLDCSLDPRLLRRILDRRSHWNNAEIGCHISMRRIPDKYEPDLHTALQFFHL
ncbi:MAG: MBL fold metallo-hydrolase [Reyranella sp.]|uniref:MBL fold metallo-hydrolase n=1 Tax=Reyranella sp. TaxID=1929291 RepID=UPI001AC1FBFC|nr:MBL fold metallo-hydrolase [Reyranella sp.]MBN9088883.1 MBL fold metallo-hydrolase [Reyranella sp.]